MTTPSPAAVARVEAAMLDRCEIREPATEGAYDPATNLHPTTPGAVVYSGACMFAEAGRGSGTGTITRGGEPELEHPYQFAIPRTETAVQPGHLVKLTAVHADGDAAALTLQFIVRRVRYGTRMARRILLCDLLQTS